MIIIHIIHIVFTTGYGDITAHNSMEQWVAIFVIVVGSIMTAYLVGTLTVLAFEGDKQSQYLQDKLDEAFSFGTYFGLSNPLIRAITAHIEYHCRYNYVYGDPHTFLRSLPQHLRDKVESEVSGKAISKIDFFDGIPQHIMGNINITLKKIACNENTVLYSEGHRSTTMYLLRIGCAVLFYGKDSQNYEKKVRILKRGDICGETCLVSEKRLNTLRCETWCEFYVLQKEDIHDILFDHYDADIADEWWQNIKQTVQKNMTKQRKVKFPETNREKKAKSKLDNDWNDSVYDDLYSCDNATNAGFIQTRPSQMGIKPDIGGVGGVGDIDEPDIVQRENVSGLVDRMRDMSRVDSGYKDFKMKQHYKFLHDKDEEIQNNKLSSSSSDTIQLTQHNTAHNIVSIAEDNEL